MNHKNINHRRTLSLILAAIFICTAFTCPVFAIGTSMEMMETMEVMDTLSGAQSRPSLNSRQRKAAKKPAKPDYSNASPADFTKRKYIEIISIIDSGQTLTSFDAAGLLRKLKENQSSVNTFDSTTLTKHYLLTAWANYFNNDINRSRQAARLAYKKNVWSKDAQLTQAAMAILTGNKPAPLPKEPVKKDTSYGNSFDGSFDSTSYGNSSENETAPQQFRLDIKSIDTGLIGAKIKEMKLNCLNSTTLEYKYGSGNICILLWKIPGDSPVTAKTHFVAPSLAPADSFESDFMSMPSNEPNGFARSVSSGASGSKTDGSGYAGLSAFKNIFADTMALPNTRFVAINMDPVENRGEILNAILENSWPWANVMLNDPQSNASQFKGVLVEQNKPLMLVAGKDGKIKYAGPAAGFLAPLVVRQMSKSRPVRPSFANIFKPKLTNNNQANAVGTTTPQKTRFLTDKTPTELSMEDDYQADKLLKNADMLIKSGSRYTTPKRGIELCRQIIGDYPGTKYADESRLLLRKVPERYRKRYHITDEELGL